MNPYEYDPEQADSVNPEIAKRFYDTATNMAIQPGAAPAAAPAPDARWMMGALAAQDHYKPVPEGAFLPDIGQPAISAGSSRISEGVPWANRLVTALTTPRQPEEGDDEVMYRTAGGPITKGDLSRGMDMAMSFSAGGLATKGVRARPKAAALGEVLNPGNIPGTIDVPAAPEMGFGSTPQGTFKNWLLRYDPETGTPAFVNKSGDTGHAFSTLKTGAKPADMTFQIANDPGYTLPPLDIAKLQKEKAELVFGPTDRLRGGGEVTHVAGQELATPVAQEGGYNFTPKNAGVAIPGMPADVDPLYAATTRTAAKVPQERATDILNRGGVPYYVPVAMTHGAGDSAKQMANTVHQLVRQAEPNADAIAKINASIAAKGGNAPDFANREAFQQWLDSGLPARTAFTKGIDTKEILKATGVDVGQARLANTMPELYHTPSGSAGLLVGRMRPDVGVTEHPLHSNYPITWMGQKGEAYRAPGSLPFSLLSPDMHRGLVPKVNQGVSAATTPAIQVMRGLPKDIPQVQPVTQEVVDNYYEWFRRHPSGWMAAGAAPLGALAATGDYQPEEKM